VRATGNTDCALQLPLNSTDKRDLSVVGQDGARTADARATAVPTSPSRPSCSASSSATRLVLEAGGEEVGPEEQLRALGAIIDVHLSQADTNVRGVCLSSFLVSGCQVCSFGEGAGMIAVPTPLPVPGLSMGEPCMGWEQTQEAVRLLAEAVRVRRRAREEARAGGGAALEGGKRRRT
jgi:hypothetical protein